jgi:hypothetical protein
VVVGVGVGLGVGDGVGIGVGDGVGLGVGVGVGEGVGLSVGNGVGLGVDDGLGVGVGDGDGVDVGDGDGLGLGVGPGVGEGDGASDGDSLGAGDGVGVGVGDGVGDGDSLGDCDGLGVGVAEDVAQPKPKKAVNLPISAVSMKPSTASGAMLRRALVGGTEFPKSFVSNAMSPVSEKVSLLISAGQASAPQCSPAVVPAEFSTMELKPSQSGSSNGTGQGGKRWLTFGQLGQLSPRSRTPSQSTSSAQGAGVAAGVRLGVGVWAEVRSA